jgi:hypothetical protein
VEEGWRGGMDGGHTSSSISKRVKPPYFGSSEFEEAGLGGGGGEPLPITTSRDEGEVAISDR